MEFSENFSQDFFGDFFRESRGPKIQRKNAPDAMNTVCLLLLSSKMSGRGTGVSTTANPAKSGGHFKAACHEHNERTSELD